MLLHPRFSQIFQVLQITTAGSRQVPDTPRGTRAAWSENHGRRGRYPPQVASAPHQSSDHTSAAGPALIERGQPRIGSTAARASKNAMVPSYARMALCRGLHAPSPGRFRDCSLNLSATRPPPEPSAAAAQPIVLLEQRGTGRTVCSTADGFRLSAVYVPIRVLFQ